MQLKLHTTFGRFTPAYATFSRSFAQKTDFIEICLFIIDFFYLLH